MGTKVNANPTKEFFISMLTRDIDIKAAILELIDNSIDGAKKLRPDGNYSGLYIHLTYDKNYFSIVDNCGGISIETATEYAFRFGRSPQRKKDEPADQCFTGVFGIGMKRSLFRLGTEFEVTSNTQQEHFKLSVNVSEWLKDDGNDWSFQLSEEGKIEDFPKEEIGTKIIVTGLHEGISKQFELEVFFNTLTAHIEHFGTLAVENGLEISINGQSITFASEKIIKTSEITPYSYIDQIGNVSIKIIAGIAPKGAPEKAGWYIYCNGRLIVYADKTALTGWGEDGVRIYHPSLAIFRGFVFFESHEPNELPWNTTKTNVDASSKYYIFAKSKMREATLQVIKASQPLSDGDVPEDTEKAVFSGTQVTLNTASINAISKSASNFSLNLSGIKTMEPMANISFKKPKKYVDLMMRTMGVKSNKEVGSTAFDYYFKRECDDDE